jgi:hypothetical protein
MHDSGKREVAMTTPTADEVDQKSSGLYRAGGISMMIVGLLYFVFVALLGALGSSFSSSETALMRFAGEAPTVQAAFGLGILADLFFIPAVVALYSALSRLNRNAMVVAVGFLGLYIVLDFAVTNFSFLALVPLSKNYLAATSDAQRAAYVAAADYVLAVIAISAPISSYLVPSIGILIASLVMLNGVFSRAVAILGIVTAALGMVYASTVVLPGILPGGFVAVATVLSGVWLVLVGAKIYQLGRR